MRWFRRPAAPERTVADAVVEARRDLAEAHRQQLYSECTVCGSQAGQLDSLLARDDVIRHLLNTKVAESVLEATGGLSWVDRAGAPIPFRGDPRWGVITTSAAISEDALLAELNEAVDDGTSSRPVRWTRGELIRRLQEAAAIGYARHEGGAWNWSFMCADCQYTKLRKLQRGETPVRQRDDVPPRRRFLIMQRDGFRCVYCGKTASVGAVLHVDHVQPAVEGGADDDDNLVTACDECNLGKGRTRLP